MQLINFPVNYIDVVFITYFHLSLIYIIWIYIISHIYIYYIDSYTCICVIHTPILSYLELCGAS